MIGDMACRKVAPKDQNWGGRLVKNMRICGSGIYTYAKQELDALHLTPVPDYASKLDFINVYRPPQVLIANKDMFARVPIITGHHVLVDRTNAKALAVGMVGDSVESEVDKEDGETYLYTTGTIIAGDGVKAYEDYGQLSVGYDPVMVWKQGKHNGVDYQAELTGFNCINHILICQVARGGPQCTIMDSQTPLMKALADIGGKHMGLLDKLFGKKETTIAGDSAIVMTLLNSIKLGASPKETVDVIRSIAGDALKDKTFDGYLSVLGEAKDATKDELVKAVDMIGDHYKKLMGDAKTEPKKEAPKKEEPKKEEPKKDGGSNAPAESDKKDDAGKKDTDKATEKDTATAGDSIDYERLSDLVVTKMKAIQVKDNLKVDAPSPVINGDSGVSSQYGSDFFMNELMGIQPQDKK